MCVRVNWKFRYAFWQLFKDDFEKFDVKYYRALHSLSYYFLGVDYEKDH